MINYEPPLSPPCDVFYEYEVPERIEEICKDLLQNGYSTGYKAIYDYLWIEAEEMLWHEKEEGNE